MHRLIRIVTVILAACAMAGTASGARAQGAPNGSPVVGVAPVTRVPVTASSQYVGRIQAINSVALVARVTAFLEQRLFTEGAEVKQGQLLYVLEQAPFQAQLLAQQGNLDQAQANVVNASTNFQRQRALLNTPAGQKQSYDNALATARGNAGAVQTAQANLQSAQINLAYTRIQAPIDGRITATAVNPGNVVSPTSGTLATIVSQDPMYVVFPVATRDLAALQKKYAAAGGIGAARIRLTLADGEPYDRDGTLDYVSPTVAANTDTLTLRATVPNPEQGGGGGLGSRRLVDGAFVTVTISDPQPMAALVVPRAAVLSDQQGDFVYAVDAANRVARANVKLGDPVDAEQVVLSGLSEGQRIVIDGLQRVHVGVQITPAAPETGAPATDPAARR